MKLDRERFNDSFTVTCTKEEKEEIFKRARESGRTMSGYVRWLVKQTREENDDRK